MANYDFFISYKWSTYANEAAELKSIADSRGFTSWIDVEHPFQTDPSNSRQPDVELGRHLLAAIGSCRYILFLETFATIAKQIGGPDVRVISWQERELGMTTSEKLITLYHGSTPKQIAFGSSRRMSPYQDLQDAFELVEEAISNPSSGLWGG